MRVFVYGTLRTGDSRHGAGGFQRMIAAEAYINGFDMLNLGGFPGLVPSPGKADANPDIRGEVHEYENLDSLDRIEGYRTNAPKEGLYTRAQVTAYTNDGEEIPNCWVYIFNNHGQRRLGREQEIIASGDWFEHTGSYEKLKAAKIE